MRILIYTRKSAWFNNRVFWVPIGEFLTKKVQIGEDFAASLWRFFNLLLPQNTDFHCITLEFDFPEPDYIASYRDIFTCSIKFDCKETKITFPASWLDITISSADPELFELFENRCTTLIKELNQGDTVDRIRSLLLRPHGQKTHAVSR